MLTSRSQEILEPYADEDVSVVQTVLEQHLKPVFQKNLHPKVNASTGRVLARSAGGDAGFQDHYEGQVWKQRPGIANVLDWCIVHIKVGSVCRISSCCLSRMVQSTVYEKLWHLVIPPVMTLLDDYEVKYKLQGVRLASHLLENAPGELLRRTGIDGLLYQVRPHPQLYTFRYR